MIMQIKKREHNKVLPLNAFQLKCSYKKEVLFIVQHLKPVQSPASAYHPEQVLFSVGNPG